MSVNNTLANMELASEGSKSRLFHNSIDGSKYEFTGRRDTYACPECGGWAIVVAELDKNNEPAPGGYYKEDQFHYTGTCIQGKGETQTMRLPAGVLD